MTKAPDFDAVAAHRYFAAQCFNRSWTLIEKSERTEEEDEQLIALGHASFWHWTQRADCAPANMSVAHWLLSRIYALVGNVAQARRYAASCLAVSERGEVAPLFVGFAHEALARAALLARDQQAAEGYLERAQELTSKVDDEEDRRNLQHDLDALRSLLELTAPRE